MRAALYIRVSTEEQSKEGYSLAAQKEKCAKFIESQPDWDLVKIYADPGVSAKDLNRPGVQQMLEDTKKGFFDVIVVYRLDRLVRRVLDLHNLLDDFEKNNVKFKSVTEVFDTTTAMGKFFITIVGAMAEWERDNLSERVSMGMEQIVREGKWKGGEVGYGHKWDRNEQEFVVVEEEAKNLIMMYQWSIEGDGDITIAHRLNEMGIATRQGNWWTNTAVGRVLRNPKNYGASKRGVRTHKKDSFLVEDVYPSIVTKETYDESMRLRRSRLRFSGRNNDNDFIYSGVLTCPRCGSTFKGNRTTDPQTGTVYKSYVCNNKASKKCDSPSVSEKMVDDKFIPNLQQALDDLSNVDIDLDDGNKEIEEQKQVVTKELQKIKERRKKWQYAWANETISDEDFSDRNAEESRKEKHYLSVLEKLERNKGESLPVSSIDEIKKLIDNWKRLNDNEKKKLLRSLVNKIVIDIDKSKKKSERLNIKEIVFN